MCNRMAFQAKLSPPASDDDRVPVAPDDTEAREAQANPDPDRIRPRRHDLQDIAISGMSQNLLVMGCI